ncbi:hypothetical protein [Teredinibacter franksiae]|uniref:hypothetical protein n=1 Tax=Teredinibacter franksiae TaxID=2761453 RepID=UPI001626D290|nr:hypothetical protein [Teredinibacter franksiae]
MNTDQVEYTLETRPLEVIAGDGGELVPGSEVSLNGRLVGTVDGQTAIWEQTRGASVEASDWTATPLTFTAPNVDGELGGMSYRGNIGFRYIETEFDIVQSEALQGQSAVFNGQEFLIGPGIVQPVGAEVSTVNKYSDFLPAINLALDLSDNQILRTSITKTVSTHNTDMLGGGLSVNRTANCDLRDASGHVYFVLRVAASRVTRCWSRTVIPMQRFPPSGISATPACLAQARFGFSKIPVSKPA